MPAVERGRLVVNKRINRLFPGPGNSAKQHVLNLRVG